jgi:ribokinase
MDRCTDSGEKTMIKKPRILVVGSINMDLVLHAQVLPQSGESAIAETYHYSAGGKGANQAAAAALLGADSFFAGKVGEDDNGRRLREGLAKFGVHTQGLKCDGEAPTGLAAILVEEGGRNRILVYPSANMRLSPADVIPLMDEVHPDAMIIQFEIPVKTVIACCQAAKVRSIPVAVDAGPAQPFPIELLEMPLIFSPNETETLALCGILPDSEESALRAAQALMARTHALYVIIKRGEHGAYIYDGKGLALNVPAIPVTAVDSTAAGDAFMAAVTIRFLQSNDIVSAVKYANHVGALTVTRAGAQASLPSAEEVERFIAERADV